MKQPIQNLNVSLNQDYVETILDTTGNYTTSLPSRHEAKLAEEKGI